jgi:hypothetical protein
MSTRGVDKFLMNKIDKKLQYWTSICLNVYGREVIASSNLTSTCLYFLALRGGTKASVYKITSKI